MENTRDYVLYLRKCPGVIDPRNFKVGITKLRAARSRLATYQNAVGPGWQDCFLRVWVGDEIHMRRAEREFKLIFKDKILSQEAGFSEWVCNISLQELVDFTEELRTDYAIKFIDVPSKFEPLTMDLCKELAEWYSEVKLKDG